MNFRKYPHAQDAVHWFVNDLGYRVVAKSGIATDRFHVGKMILQSLKDAPNYVLQIDGGTGESEIFQTALERSVRCATAFRNLGLKANDVIAIMAPNHINITIPMYAAFYLGISTVGIDPTLKVKELTDTFQIYVPKIIFCQSAKAADIEEALKHLNSDVRIVTFDKELGSNCSFTQLIEKYGDNTPVEDFQPSDLDPEETIGLLVSTSGTTGVPKCAALTYKNIMIGFPYTWIICSEFPTPTEMVLVVSPIQWLSATSNFVMSPILRFTRVHTSLPVTPEHVYFLINKYKPTYMIINPTMMTTLIKPGECEKCDFSCFRKIFLGGSAVTQILLDNVKKIAPASELYTGYGLSEIASIGFNPMFAPPGSCGRPLGCTHYRIVDPATGEDIFEPNKTGELWLKSPLSFKGYYNNPKVTADTYAEGKWIKSGDLFYRDENWNFFYVDRLKLLLKYRNHQISPIELETTIRKHPGVLDVAVTSFPDEECGDLPVACVIPQDNYPLSAQEIKDMVKQSLTDSKQLRGGVVFFKELPLTSTSKVNRVVLKQMVKDMKRE